LSRTGWFNNERALQRITGNAAGQDPVKATHAAVARVDNHSYVLAVDFDFDRPALDEPYNATVGVLQFEQADQIGLHFEPPLTRKVGRGGAERVRKSGKTDDR
jgi:hypothetical protein